jgi:hypothetical protein
MFICYVLLVYSYRESSVAT